MTKAVKPVLRGKQQLFVDEYLIDLNATQAAIRAGYSKRTAYRTGADNLKKPHVAHALAKALAARGKKLGVDSAEVLRHLNEMRLADPVDVINDDGTYKLLSEWPIIWRQMLSAFEIRELISKEGTKEGEMLKLKFVDRLKVIELIGRHVNVMSWIEQTEVTHLEGRSQRLAAASKRVIEMEQDDAGTYKPTEEK